MIAPPISLDPSTLANFLIGTLLPVVIAYITGHYASSRYKAAFAFSACVVVATVVTVLTKAYTGTWGANGADNAQLVALNIVTLLFTAWQFFARLWQPLGVTGALEQAGPQLGATKAVRATKNPGIH